MSSISEWTGLIVRDRQQGRQEVTVQTAAGTADPTSLTHSRTASPLIPVLAREDAAASRIASISPFTSSVAPRAGAVSPFLTGHPQP